MFIPLVNLRLVVIDSLNNTPDTEQEPTAQAWIDMYELEASKLIEGVEGWLPIAAYTSTPLRRRHARQWARMQGQVDARMALIVADQAVAALIRGHLAATL